MTIREIFEGYTLKTDGNGLWHLTQSRPLIIPVSR